MILQISTKKLVWLYPLGSLILVIPTIFNLPRLINYQFQFYGELTGGASAGAWSLLWFSLITIGYLIIIYRGNLTNNQLMKFSIFAAACLLTTVPFGSTDVFYLIGAARDEILHDVNPYLGGFYKVNPFLLPQISLSGPIMYPALWLELNKIIWMVSQRLGILGQVYSYKLLFLFCHAATAVLVGKVVNLKFQAVGNRTAFLYFLNPLLLFEFATNAHFDAVMILFVTLGIYWIAKKRLVLGITALSTAVLIKYTAILFFPFLVWPLLVSNKSLSQLKNTLFTLLKGAILSALLAALSFYPYWIQTGPKILAGISTQSDWFANSLFSTIYVPIIFIYQTFTATAIPSVSAKYLWLLVMFIGMVSVLGYLNNGKIFSNIANVIFKLSWQSALELTTLLIVVFVMFFQRSFWPWYASWPFLTGALLGNTNRLYKLSLIFTLSSLAFYLIYGLFGYNSMQSLDNLQVLYGLVVFAPVLFLLFSGKIKLQPV